MLYGMGSVVTNVNTLRNESNDNELVIGAGLLLLITHYVLKIKTEDIM